MIQSDSVGCRHYFLLLLLRLVEHFALSEHLIYIALPVMVATSDTNCKIH